MYVVEIYGESGQQKFQSIKRFGIKWSLYSTVHVHIGIYDCRHLIQYDQSHETWSTFIRMTWITDMLISLLTSQSFIQWWKHTWRMNEWAKWKAGRKQLIKLKPKQNWSYDVSSQNYQQDHQVHPISSATLRVLGLRLQDSLSSNDSGGVRTECLQTL